MLVVVGRMARR